MLDVQNYFFCGFSTSQYHHVWSRYHVLNKDHDQRRTATFICHYAFFNQSHLGTHRRTLWCGCVGWGRPSGENITIWRKITTKDEQQLLFVIVHCSNQYFYHMNINIWRRYSLLEVRRRKQNKQRGFHMCSQNQWNLFLYFFSLWWG